jgi:dihydroneopterin aldolase
MLYDDLEGTLDYEIIYHIVKKNMQQPVKLIEYLAHNIIADLREVLSDEDTIKLKIRKLNPPLGAKIGASVVELED